MVKRAIFFLLAGVVVLAGTVFAGPKEVAEIVKAAEREGKVTWTSSLKDEEAAVFMSAFKKEYPKIEVIHEREHGSMERFIRELVAGALQNDVVKIDPDLELEILDMNVLEQVNWADFNVVPQLQLAQNRMIGPFSFSYVFVYNTKSLKKEETPKTWEDLLDPKWKGKGKFVVDTDCNAFLWLVGAWGPKKVLDYASKLGKQNPQFVRGQSETMNLMSAGNYTLSANGMLSSALFVAKKGGPLAWNIPDPVPLDFFKLAILKKCQHPNAAKVFLGWLGSKGYKLMDQINEGRSVPFGGTFVAEQFKSKTLSWSPSREQLPNRQEFFSQLLKALGVPK